METTELIEKCKELLPERNKPVMFDTAMIVKNSPHNEICRCYGVVVTDDDELKLMDAEEKWHIVLPNQVMVEFVLQTLYQRLKTMSIHNSFA